MNLTIDIQETMSEFVSWFTNSYIPKNSNQSAKEAVESAIFSRYKTEEYSDCVLLLLENQAKKAYLKDTREKAEKQIIKGVTFGQADLHSDLNVDVPEFFIDNKTHERKPYHESSLTDGYSYYMTKKSGLKAEIDSFKQHIAVKEQQLAYVEEQLERIVSMMAIAREKGLNPDEVLFAKKDS